MFGGLFSKASAIDNDKLVNEKKRTVIQLRKKERKEKRRQDKLTAAESENKDDDASAMDIDESDEEVAEDLEKKVVEKDEDDGELEDKYMAKLLADDEDEESEEEFEEAKEEVNESENKEEEEIAAENELAKEEEKEEEELVAETTAASAAKILDLKDKEFEKAERTIFIGNVPSTVATSKSGTKELKRFVNEFLECPENENLIESIRFRSIHSTTTAPRKVAFIAKEIDLKNTVNCYIVLKKKEDSLKSLKLNGLVFKDHHLRVDHLAHPLKKDNKLSIFVGNLDFQEKEETLWRYFNNRLIESDEKKTLKNVISNVRIIRDPKTSFGKGFAIIQFIDTNYVSKALLLDGKKMANRPLRISRSKKVQRNNETMRSKFTKLNDNQKTVVGRAKQLGKIDRRTLGNLVIEGERAKVGVKNNLRKASNGKVGKQRHGTRQEKRAKARITSRSQTFKEKNAPKNIKNKSKN